MITNLGRTEAAIITNKSGGDLLFGAVVIVDTANALAFKTTTTAAYISGRIGVVLDPGGIVDNGVGLVAFSGWIPQINLDGSAAIGDLVKTSTVAGQGTPHASPIALGDFAQVLETGTTPQALLFGVPMPLASGGGVYFAPTGLTGATAASRYVGATASGAPVTGTFAVGDYVIDRTGAIIICTVAGSPGTWVSPAAAPVRVLIQESTPTGVGTVTFAAISGTYKKLVLEYALRSTQAANNVDLIMQFNADTTAGNYRYIDARLNTFGLGNDNGSTYTLCAQGVPGASSAAGSFAVGITQIPQYANAGFQKSAITNLASYDAGNNQQIVMGNLRWLNTAAITQIVVALSAGNFDTNSVLRLYGEN